MSFEYDLHVFRSSQFQGIVDDAIRFFNLTPLHSLPPTVRFAGAGVYALYYKGDYALYAAISQANLQNCVQLKPLWNSVVDGFGNHDPGSGRYNQAKSEWDVLHPGRSWAEKLIGEAPHLENVVAKIRNVLG